MAGGGPIKVAHTETFKTEAAVLAGRIVKLGATEGEVLHAVAITDVPIGIAVEDQSIVGEGVKIATLGEVWCESGEAIVIGDLVAAVAAGKGSNDVAAAGTEFYSIGIALSAASATDLQFRVLMSGVMARNLATT